MSKPRSSPLVGYNTGVQYRGVPYHIQTEDSGIDHPHVITHLFAEGGHVVATRKTSYAQHVGTDAYPDVVRGIIRAQHKEMIVALRDGHFDALLPAAISPGPPAALSLTAPAPVSSGPEPSPAVGRRAQRASLADGEISRDSLDEIIVGDLIQLLDKSG